MRKVGLHIRLEDTIVDVARKAKHLSVPIFQCFFVQQKTNKFITLTDDEMRDFKKKWASQFDCLYAHASYWINLAAARAPRSADILKHELHLAAKLGFSYLILHPGSATGSRHKKDGIDHLARALNSAIEHAGDVIITLENTAHAKLSIGGDLEDFKILKEKIDKPEKIQFCIDTAHAYCYGYDIANPKAQDEYIKLLQEYIGLANIAVLHINDASDGLGSRIDRHAVPGKGKIGIDALKRFVSHQALQSIPILLELPPLPEQEEKEIIDMIKAW